MNRKIDKNGWKLIASILIFGVFIYELITGEIPTRNKDIVINRVNQPIEFWAMIGIKGIGAFAFAYSGIVGIIEESKPK